MPAMNITKAERVFVGAATNPARSGERSGALMACLVQESFTPEVADADGVAESQSVVVLTSPLAVLDGILVSGGVATFDIPRNVVAGWTGTAVLTVTGTDEFGRTVIEVSASGTSLTGSKRFKTITSASFSADVTLASVGTGTKLGLTYKPTVGGFIRGRLNEDTADAGTYPAPNRSTITSTSADERGMYAYAGTANGSNVFTVLYTVETGPQDSDLFGDAPYDG
jgi:hypothetical protein